MNEIQFADEVIARVRELSGRYNERAYLFVLAALEFAQSRLPQRRHISGAELAWACRDFALEQFGLMARTVLEHWGLFGTDDLGQAVFTLVEVGLLSKEDSDRVEDFAGVYEFAVAFEGGYRWPGLSQSA